MSTDQNTGALEEFSYDDSSVKLFLHATIIWGAVALLLGVVIALQLASWQFNFNLEWFTFGRLRPLHTNAAVFAFCGNAMFAGIYYSTQRLCKARLYNDFLSRLHF
ncbi:MAG: cytochrome C oxidase Cbb3, partial [Halobacteriovoraceae bacterium]|nr:cytochrome C oxidase Cbb3 [Halobacteriovoraceae bacterium]